MRTFALNFSKNLEWFKSVRDPNTLKSVKKLGCASFFFTHFPVFGCYISNPRKSVSSGYPNTEKWVEKRRRSRVFETNFRVFHNSWRHSEQKFAIFMLIKIRYPNHRHVSDFLFNPLFSLYGLLTSLRNPDETLFLMCDILHKCTYHHTS